MFSILFIVVVILIYFVEIKWRKKQNKPLNKGNPIDGGQYLIFWVVSSVSIFMILIFMGLFFNSYWEASNLFLYSFFEDVFSHIYYGYTSSETGILKAHMPYFMEEEGKANHISLVNQATSFEFIQHVDVNQRVPYEMVAGLNQDFVSILYLYREVIMALTIISLIFGRKFIYAPFFEMKKAANFTLNKVSLAIQIILTVLFMSGLLWFIFVVPTHSTSCSGRMLSFWCMDLGGKGWRYFGFPTLLLFYWTCLLIAINAFTQAILTELGYTKQKENEHA